MNHDIYNVTLYYVAIVSFAILYLERNNAIIANEERDNYFSKKKENNFFLYNFFVLSPLLAQIRYEIHSSRCPFSHQEAHLLRTSFHGTMYMSKLK